MRVSVFCVCVRARVCARAHTIMGVTKACRSRRILKFDSNPCSSVEPRISIKIHTNTRAHTQHVQTRTHAEHARRNRAYKRTCKRGVCTGLHTTNRRHKVQMSAFFRQLSGCSVLATCCTCWSNELSSRIVTYSPKLCSSEFMLSVAYSRTIPSLSHMSSSSLAPECLCWDFASVSWSSICCCFW